MRFKYLFFLFPFLILSCAGETNTVPRALDYVDPNAAVVLKINHLASFTESLEKNEFLQRWEATDLYGKISTSTAFLKQLDSSSSGILMLSSIENDSSNFLYIANDLNNMFAQDSLRNKYAQESEPTTDGISRYLIEDVPVFGKVDDQLVLIASSEETIEKALAQKQQAIDTLFEKMFDLSNLQRPGSMLVRTKHCNALLAGILKQQDGSFFDNFPNWVLLDVQSMQKGISLNGISIHQDSTRQFLDIFKNTRPLPIKSAAFAPIETNALTSYSFDDFAILSENLRQYNPRRQSLDTIFGAVEEVGLATIAKERVVILNTYGSEIMADYLMGIRIKETDYQGATLLTLSNTSFLNNTFQPLITNFKARYATILDNTFIFCETQETLERVVTRFRKGNTFDTGSVYQTLRASTATAASVWYLGDAEHVSELANEHLDPDILKQLKTPKLNGYAYSVQVVSDKNAFLTDLIIRDLRNVPTKTSPNFLFEIKLENPIANIPQFALNHVNKQKEIVVQDVKNQLYLISPSGTVLWKKQLDGRIQGKVHQVDVYKNNRLQLAFTTANKLWVLDRNGKEVTMLCKDYGGEALNPLAVFDYDKKKEYRFVVTQAKKVFMYDRKGKMVKGFKFREAESIVATAPKHIVIGDKDHLVFKLQDGTLKILNRRGEVRVPIDQKINFSANDIFGHQNRFIVTDKKGSVYKIDASGKMTSSDSKLNPDHGITANNELLVTLNDGVLYLNDTEVHLEISVYDPPQLFKTTKGTLIGITDVQNEKIYLFNSQGELFPGFPLEGNATLELSDLGSNNQLQLVTRQADSTLTSYKVN